MSHESPGRAGLPGGPPGRSSAEAALRSVDGRPSARLGQHLRRLREGYGYTLRKVEEKAFSLGESIDNSQLSRFEKGKALPSFDKLRALARIFNVSIQNFSDVLDLEEFEPFKPETDDYDALLTIGAQSLSRGEYGRAFVAYEKAVEVAERNEGPGQNDRLASARWSMATALKALGKLSMCEHELREILKLRNETKPGIQIRALLQLGSVYRELGDLCLAEVLVRESLALAVASTDAPAHATALNTLANIYETSDLTKALAFYERAHEVLAASGGANDQKLVVLTNLGGCLVKAGRFQEGLAKLQAVHGSAREYGYRRIAALSATRIGEAYLQHADVARASHEFAESDTLASDPAGPYHDILFLNAFHRWVGAKDDGNGTREKIAFGRLRHLRSLLERRFPEVDEFDRWVAKHRRFDHEHFA
ncbi:MAG TPA: helix-turn-helix transcriptional regulator [Candidatus Polarisedimenticolaceae bacterium]|nr:helix-turn-helix transcriptional regulator [Candidatus Polarisedimenticolaceae bacterium]